MNHIIGFILFWIGVGMFITLIVPKSFFMVVTAAVLMLVGYNLFCK